MLITASNNLINHGDCIGHINTSSTVDTLVSDTTYYGLLITAPVGEMIHILVDTRVVPNLTFSNSAEAEFGRISELKFGRSRSRI